MVLKNRFAVMATGLLGLVASCTTPQPLPDPQIPIIVEKPALVAPTEEERLDSMYAGFIKAYNSAKSSRSLELSYLRNNDGALTLFREGRAHDHYLSNLDKMQCYIAEIKSLGAETRPFDILLDTIK